MPFIDKAKSRFADESQDGVYIATAPKNRSSLYRIRWCNEAFVRQTGYSREEFSNAQVDILCGPDSSAEAVEFVNSSIKAGKGGKIRVLLYRKDQSTFWADLAFQPIKGDTPEEDCWIVSQRDVTEEVELQRKLAEARLDAQEVQKRLWSAIEALPDAFVLFDAEDRVVIFNSHYLESYSRSADIIKPGTPFEDIIRHGLAHGQYPEAAGREFQWLRERLDYHANPTGQLEQLLPDGTNLLIREVKLDSGDTVGFRTDVTKIKRQQRELEAKARALEVAAKTDPLTGLANRRGLDEEMEAAAATNDANKEFAVLHVDLDRFKPINDVFGHAAGDYLLGIVADILRASVRADDVIARVGGDEFVVFQRISTSESAAIAAAERIFEGFRQPVTWDGKPLHFGCSIGISTGSRDQIGGLLQDADIALYQAKDAGRGRYHLFTPELRRATEDRKRISDEILDGIDRGEFLAYYQPQVTADGHRLDGIEALARWKNPKRGLMLPDTFIAIADELGVLPAIENCVMKDAFETVHHMADAGFDIANLSFNVSIRRLAALSDLETLEGYTEAPCRVSFELLEAIDYDDGIGEMMWIIDAIRELGIGLELDDFGSGRASLTSLLSLRPDRIKIDRKIVSAALHNRSNGCPLLKAISQMCGALKIPMTAEGVETAQHAVMMRELGCDKLQGFHFAPPLSRDDLVTFAAAQDHRATSSA